MNEKIFIKSEGFDCSSSCHLLLELNERSYNFAIVDTLSNAVKCLGRINSPFKNDSSEIPSFPYSKISISTFTKSFVFIPETEFKEDLEHSFFSFLPITPGKEEIFSNFLQNDNPIRNIYSIRTRIISELNVSFENARIYTQTNSLYEGAVRQASSGLFVNLKDQHAEVMLLSYRNFEFYNVFEVHNAQELLYFLLLTLQQRSLKAQDIPLFLSGNVDEATGIYDELKSYFPTLSYSQNKAFVIGDEFEATGLHQFFTLLSLYQCA